MPSRISPGLDQSGLVIQLGPRIPTYPSNMFKMPACGFSIHNHKMLPATVGTMDGRKKITRQKACPRTFKLSKTAQKKDANKVRRTPIATMKSVLYRDVQKSPSLTRSV